LAWAGSVEPDVVGYKVYRLTSADDAAPQLVSGAKAITATSYVDAAAAPGATWFYRVSAVDASGNESTLSDPASAQRPASDLPPAAPEGLTVAVGYGGITLRWTPSLEGDVTGYNVYRGTPGGNDFIKLNPALLSAPTWDDTAAAAGRAWEYRITAVDAGAHESAPAVAVATRPSPSAPTIGLVAPAAVDEGSPFQLTLGDVSYSGTGQISKYVVRWGDGAVEEFLTPGPKTHVFADGTAVRDVVVDLFDGATTYAGAGTVRVTVDDVAPTLFAVGNDTLPIGGEEDLQLFVTDPGQDAIGGWLVNWGDGSLAETVALGVARARHRYDRPGSYTISATASNDDGTFSNELIVVRVKDGVAPTAAPEIPPILTRRGAEPFLFTVTYADELDMAEPAANAVAITGPNGFSAVAQVILSSNQGKTRVVKYALAAPGGSWDEADDGTYEVRLRDGGALDAGGNAVPAGVLGTFHVGIIDAPPGTTFDTAVDLGTLSRRGRKLNRDLLGAEKGQLYYRLTVTEPLRLCAALSGLRGNADLELLKADGTRLGLSAKTGRRGEKINLVVPAGTYVVHVSLNGSPATPFKLSILGKVPSRKALAAAGLL
jgi:hypothetical protein